MTDAFALVAEPASWWPVKIDAPADGGRVTTHTIELKFARLGIDDFNRLWVEGAAIERDYAETKAASRALFDRVVRGWRNIADAQGSPVPYADPYIAQLLDVPGMPEAFGAAYADFWRAVPAVVEGNSDASPAGGPATGDATTTAAPTGTATRSRPRSGGGARPKRR